jgi:polyhydroxyalkanoate synthesis regulator phasin
MMLPPSAHTLIDALQSAYGYLVQAEDVGKRMADVAVLRLHSVRQAYATMNDALEEVREMHEALEAEARKAHTLEQRMTSVESKVRQMQSEMDALRTLVFDLERRVAEAEDA